MCLLRRQEGVQMSRFFSFPPLFSLTASCMAARIVPAILVTIQHTCQHTWDSAPSGDHGVSVKEVLLAGMPTSGVYGHHRSTGAE